ncbi:hypothetical protein [Oceanicoccus sagamiensis]|uniref:MSHA biogenesis protein MshJ n=1 Tax=Oceanicoccus sagamiensis TaxID=716816 RepID=A0A1X9N7D1_9GAMM|nr:hypothetical protein [Oceanicoccus sagamiensis]ARN73596.1 hypothetical protein BST96_05355 [Oceanicoccus sagamiensis]
MNDRLATVLQKIDSLNQRERILVLLTALVLVVMLLQIALLDPLLSKRQKLASNIKSLNSQIQQQSNEKTILEARLTAGINRDKIKRREQLQSQREQLNKKIEASLVAMIPPRLMPEVLERVLAETKGLKLLSIANKPVVAVVRQQPKTDNSGSDAAVQQALYNHGFILQLKGNYMEAITYFEKLSELPWRFHWDDMRYQVEQYPNAIITLEVHTVSMSEEWIGV